jgi:hypothetical protein
MKKLIVLLTILTFCFTLYAELETITVPASTNSVATLTLDARKGTTVPLPQVGLSDVRITASAPSVAGNTNGNLVIYLERGQSKTGPWDDYSQSNIKVTVSGLGAATNSNSGRFNLTGIQWIRVGAYSNSTAGTYTNPVITITYPQPASHQ